jgi:hypothetical protein
MVQIQQGPKASFYAPRDFVAVNIFEYDRGDPRLYVPSVIIAKEAKL